MPPERPAEPAPPDRGASFRSPGLPWVVGATFPWIEYVEVKPARIAPRAFVATVVGVTFSGGPGRLPGLIVQYQEAPGGPTGSFWVG